MSSNDGGDEQQAGISNLQENFFKQQKKISALKELVMKSEVAHGKSTSSAQEKVKNIAQRLTNLKSKARSRKSLEKTQDDAAQRQATAATATKNTEKLNQLTPALPVTLTIGGSYSTTTPNPTPLKASSQQSEANTTTPLSALSTTTSNPHNLLNVSSSHVATPGSEKILLLRQQMEENKLRMAQRASSKQHLEQLVSQLKEKFDSTQQSLEDTSELGRSMTDLSAFAYTSASRERHKSATDLSAQPFNLERERMKFLENRCRLLEKQLEKEKQAHSMSLNESVVTQETTKRIKELENKILELEEALGEQQATTRIEQELQAEIERLKSDLLSQEQQSSTRIEEELQAEIERLKTKLHSQEQQSTRHVELELQAEIERLKCELQSRERTAAKEVSSSSAVEELSAFEADELGNENERLKSELTDKLKRITELEEINDLLETTRCELASKNTSYAEQLQEIEASLKETEQKLTETQKQLQEAEERCSSLESTLEKLANSTEAIVVQASSTASKTTIDTDAQIKAEMAKQIQELQDELQLVRDSNAELEKRLADTEKLEVSDVTIAEKIKALEATIESQREDIQTRLVSSNRYEEELMEKTIELNVLNANFKVLEEKLQATNKTKPLFTATAEENASQNPELLAEVQQLKQKLDEANKASIKLKLKCKQTEKQMEKLKKTTDLHAEVVRLEKEKEQLQQKITELEDEKGQWQLQQMGTDSEAGSESSTQMTAEEQLKLQAETIRLLEEQKYEYTEKLEAAQSELQELKQKHRDTEEAERVSAEMCELKLEEQLAAQSKTLTQLTGELSEKDAHITELKQQLEELSEEKQAIAKKLEHYLSENMELLSKVDKLSKSSSSAESIEIVERLTQQERAEIDEFNKRSHMEHEHEHGAEETAAHESQAHTHSVNEVTQTSVVEMNPELSDSLIQLREESSELINKIELFTTERREVLEKMEHLTTENQELLKKIEELQVEKEELETNALLADNEKSQLELKLQEMSKEKQLLASQVAESSAQQAKLSQDLTSLQQSSEVVAVLEGAEGTTLFDKCEKSLSKLNSELEAYRKANDKNAKFNASKKLAKEAKNAYTQLSELLQKVKEASSAVEMVTVVETVVAVTAPNGKALAEYEQLTAQNRELKATIEELRRELQEAREDNQHGHIEISELPAITPSSPKPEVDNKALVEEYEKQLHEKENLLKEKDNQFKEIESQLKEKQRQLEDNERQLRDHEKQSTNFEVHLKEFEAQCSDLQATVDDLRLQLQEARLAESEKSEEVQRLREDVQELRKMSSEFDRLINDKEMSHEKQIEQATRLRKELEGKCETYESEMEILQTLITEQKQQLIEAYKENEHAINLKLLELQQRDEELAELRAELAQLQRTSAIAGEHLSDDLQRECEKLRDALKINKNLVAEQLDELANKQETIDTLSQQITELYKSMEENANKIIEKEDEITYLQELLDANTKEMERLRKENAEQQAVVDKVLEELHSHRTNMQQVPLLEAEVHRLDAQNRELAQGNNGLEQRNKDLMEKLKKYAANLKKRASQCQEYELKIAALEKGATESQNTKEQDDELREFVERNNQLNANIAQLETTLQEAQTDAAEIRVAIQEKTVQLLEAMEKNSKLELELEQAKETVERQGQDVRQLQNALAASEDWGNETQSSEDALKIENLNAELTAKTASLERAEQTLNEVQSELLLMQEGHRERLRSEQELRQELEKKTQLIQELTNSQPAPFNTDRALTELEQRLENVTEELKTKALKFEKSKAVIKERNNQIHRLQAEIKELQSKLAAQPEEESSIEAPIVQSTITPVQSEEHQTLKNAYEALTAQYQADKANFEQTISRLETLHDGIQAKLQEDLAYIESLEQENAKYKEKICKLEDCVGEFEERRASMERRANLLDAQMQTRAEAYERSEDALVYRLNALSEHDDIIAQRLLDSQVEKEELQERLQQLQLELTDLQSEHAQLQNDHQKLRAETIDTLEAEIATQRTQLNAITEEMKHMRASYDAKLAVKSTEIDELECELSEQLQQIHAEKRALTEDLERSRDECSAQKDEVVRLNESLNALEQAKTELDREASWLRMSQESAQQDLFELQELRMQSIQDKSELDHLRHQIETLAANHEIELQGLRTQIAELDSLRMQVGQNQTDDQVFIETENKRLTDLLAEKEAQLENYQRQNLQLQMAAAATPQQPQTQQQPQIDPFALAFGLPPTPNNTPAQGSNEERLERLERELAERTENVQRLQRDLNALQAEFHSVNDGNTELQRQLADKQLDIENLRLQLNRTSTSSNDVIPAPLFFASDQAAPSPFDDLVPTRAVNTHVLEGAITAGSNSGYPTLEQPTIEDLQRNVSDLEKHAHDLEQKLLMRNQRDGELEERLRDAQERLQQREEQLQQLQEAGRQQQLQQTQHNNETQQQLSELQVKLNAAEQQLNEREAALRNLQIQRENELKHLEEHSQNSAVERLAELQANLEQLQQLLQERDTQLQQLQRTLAEETHLKVHEKDLESQILPEPCEVDAALAAAAPTLEMFFGGCNAGEFEKLITAPNTAATSEPVVEELIVPKKAYVCHPQEEALNLMDGWGDSWGGDGQEEAHFAATANEPLTQSHSLIPREQQLEFKIQEQQERIQELQLAQERCEQQKQELQLKSGKLMKKLKEYKQKMDELQAANASANTFRKSCSVESNTMFSDLDAAIQEELKTQIVQLEARLEEQRKLQENQFAEKEKLLKRIDVLTAGNERMSELKERQDMDVQMYQSRIRELQNKLKNLEEWGDSEPVVETAPVSQRAEDTEYLLQEQQLLQQKNTTLEAELQDLNDERQELQAMLDEEKANVRYVEETVRNLQNQLASIENADKSKYNELTLEHQNLRELYTLLEDENARLKLEVDKLQKLKTELEENLQKASANEELELQVKELREQNEQLQMKLQTREQQENETQMQLLEHRTRCAELVQQIEDLRQAPVSEELEEKVYTLTSEKQQLEHALTAMQSEMTALQATVHNSPIAPAYTETNQDLDELAAQLQEKESEIVHLKQRIEDLMREDQTEKLVLEILTKNQEIHMLKMQVRRLEEDKQEMEHNLSLQITKEMQESKTAAIPSSNTEGEETLAMLRSQVAELQKRQQEVEAEKRNMEAELEVLNNHVLSSLEQEDKLKAAILEIDAKNIEIAELRQTLETQKSSAAPAVDFVALNSQWEAHVEQKCSEIAEMWRAHLEQREKEFKTSEMKLQEEIAVLRAASAALPQQQQMPQEVVSADTTATSSASDESTSVSPSSSVAASKTGTPLRRHTHHHHIHADSINQEDSETEADAMIERMQAALESQEMEIVTLKEQLAIRSAEYARLAAQYDPFKLQTTLSHSGVNTMTGSIESPSSVRNTSTGDSSVVPKTELDLALYMLHQRDMRCEEMTLELVSLLEERDTLQLKLSNTLRQVEDIKRQTNYVEPTQTQGAEATSSSAPYDSPVKTSVAGTTAGDTSDELSQKLWQLQTVNHSKDKIIKEDRDERIRQMKIIQEDVAKMPSQALSEIVGSDLSQTSQSPSSVLLNWLWGNKPQNPTGGAPPS